MSKILAILIYLLMALDISAKTAYATDALQRLKMEAVLESYNSPMEAYATELINIATAHGLDWTLLAAIAGSESSFGKHMPVTQSGEQCINPYGWGIYSSNKLCYASFPEAALAVATGLSTRYNTTSLETIGATYNKVNTASWISHTRFFMNKIRNASVPVDKLPIEL